MAQISSQVRSTSKVTLILDHFDNYLVRSKRFPNGLEQLWRETCQSDNASTAKIFLGDGGEKGFYTWFAYTLLKVNASNTGHFPGKVTCGHLVNEIENTSKKDRELLAREVAEKIKSNEKLKGLYKKMAEHSDDTSRPSRKRPRIRDDNTLRGASIDISSTISPSSGANVSTHDISLEEALMHPASNHAAQPDGVVVNASLAALRRFPQYLSEAIKRNPDPTNNNVLVAAIAMTFPDGRVMTGFGCQMTIHITDNKIEHLARILFDVHLETTLAKHL